MAGGEDGDLKKGGVPEGVSEMGVVCTAWLLTREAWLLVLNTGELWIIGELGLCLVGVCSGEVCWGVLCT